MEPSAVLCAGPRLLDEPSVSDDNSDDDNLGLCRHAW